MPESRGRGRSAQKRVLVSDPIGDGVRLVTAKAAELGAEVAVFEQAAAMTLDAARSSADLIVIFRPDSMAPLERLRNDPRTRHIPVILVADLKDPDQRLQAVAAADQIVDYPFEDELLKPWIEAGLKRDFHRGVGGEFAEAKPGTAGMARWLGRVSWVSGRTMRFETDIVLAEDARVGVEGALIASRELPALEARVVSRSRDDVFYNHEYRYELEFELPPAVPSLSTSLAGDRTASAARKRKIAVVSTNTAAPTQLSAAVDGSKIAVRWISTLDGVLAAVQHIQPVILVVDPDTEGLDESIRSGGLIRAAKEGIPLLPLRRPAGGKFWERAGGLCRRLDVPELSRGSGWDELIGSLAPPPPDPRDAGRVYLRREHAFSHARIVVPMTLASVTEVGGLVDVGFGVGADARVRLDAPDLEAAGVLPLHGRALRATRKGEPVKLAWMGVGNKAESTALRLFVQDSVMAQRRKQYEAVPPVLGERSAGESEPTGEES